MCSLIKTPNCNTNPPITIYALLSNFWISRFTRFFALPHPAPPCGFSSSPRPAGKSSAPHIPAIYPTFLVVFYVPTGIHYPGTQLHFPVHLPWGQVQRLCTSLWVAASASASVSPTNVWYHHHHHHHGLYHHHNHHQVIMESGHHDLSGAWQMPTVQSTGAAPKLTSTVFTSEDHSPIQGYVVL